MTKVFRMNSFNNGHLILSGLAMDFGVTTLSQGRVTPSDLRNVIDTIKAAHWTKPIIERIESRIHGRINFFLRLLRSTKITQTEYTAIKDTLVDPIGADSLTVQAWTLWDELMLKYNLQKSTEYVDLRATIKMLHQGTIKAPIDLANISKKEAHALDLSLFARGTVVTLWQCAKCQFDYPTNQTTKRFHGDPDALPKIIDKLAGKTIDQTPTYKEFTQIAESLGLPQNFDQLTPGNKVKLLHSSNADRSLITRYLTLGAEINILRTIKQSLPSVRSGVKSYMRFCALLARPAFPPTTDTVQLWSATFKPGGTFSDYLAHLQKASVLLDHPLDWLTPAIRTMAKGLKKAQDLSFKFPNFIQTNDLLTLLRWVKLDSPEGQAYFLSFLFALRVPSETLRLTRAFSDDRITEFVPQTDKALIGIRTYETTSVLVIKFAYRKNIRNGCILMRPCLCKADSTLAHDLCPVHRIWPHIRDRVDAGSPLFPRMTANNFNRTLKGTMTALGFDQGGLYSSHAFRRGATQEVSDSGSTLGTILGTGNWLSACYKNYLDLKADEAANISALLLDRLGSDSDESDPDQKQTNLKRIKKRTLKVPMTFRNPGNSSGAEDTDLATADKDSDQN